MRRTLILALFSVPLLSLAATAQEEDTEQPERPKTALERTREVEQTEFSPQELLTTAIQRIQRQRDYVVRARIKHKQPEVDPAKPGNAPQGVQIVVRANGVGPEDDPFEGDVEAWRDEDGISVIVSEKEFPGFGLYIDGDKTIRRLTFENKAPGLSQLQAELLSLLDGRRLASHLSTAKLDHRRDEATGDHIYSGKISRDIVRPTRAVANDPVAAAMMAARMSSRVLRAEVELRLTKDGALKQSRFTIVHNDPAREMMQGRFGGRIILQGGANGGLVPVQQKDEKDGENEKHEIEGLSAVYTLDLTATEASERAKAFKRAIQRVAGK